MYLSRIEINPYRRDTIHALSSPQVMHAAVMASFSALNGADDDRVLWRIDRVGPSTYVLVQSRRKPDFHHMVEQFGRPDSCSSWDTIEYDDFLKKINNGDVMRFRLRANPVHSVSSLSQGSRGKVVAHVTVQQQKTWLEEKAPKLGFEITDSEEGPMFDIVSRDCLRFKRGNGTVILNTATYEGILTVTDADLFRSSIENGIGRAKAYGCGLMTVIRT